MKPSIEAQRHWLAVAEVELNGRHHLDYGQAIPAIRAAYQTVITPPADREACLLVDLVTAQTRIAELERTNALLAESSRAAAVQLGETLDERDALSAKLIAGNRAPRP